MTGGIIDLRLIITYTNITNVTIPLFIYEYVSFMKTVAIV